MSLGKSLIAWFTGVAAVVIGGASIALYTGVRGSLLAGVDAELEARARGIGALCEWENESVHLEGYYERGGEEAQLEEEFGFEVRLQPSGRVAVARGTRLPAPLATHEAGATTYPGRLRVLARTIVFPPCRGGVDSAEPAAPGFTVLVRVASSLQAVDAEMTEIAWLSAITTLAAVAVVFAFASFLSRRVTRPLDELGSAAVRVRDGLSNRIPMRGTGDEIDRLALLFDQAFTTIRGSVERERRFVADASHELRNPVAILQSNAEVALRRERTAAEYRAFLVDNEGTARRMGQMLEALLILARLDGNQGVANQVVDVAAIARAVVDEAAATSSKSIATDAASPTNVVGDPSLLRVLCRNLLSNAVRHARSLVEVAVRRDGCRVLLRVADDGPGVDPEERARLFERFFRGRGSAGTEGAGLGLALSRSIVHAHRGDCRIESSAAGFVVLVDLPATLDDGGGR